VTPLPLPTFQLDREQLGGAKIELHLARSSADCVLDSLCESGDGIFESVDTPFTDGDAVWKQDLDGLVGRVAI
jgi:hypothetical protein